ncbi:putative metal-binding motif-containing protein [Archangium lansingense]|uniref:putative metal-binding motif-containing protein n=1 Tax=Archangium lansingense TaxID=2995310 RepID=UPI003B806193
MNACVNGVEQTCTPSPPQAEVCNDRDDNCNGAVDDMPALSCGIGACHRTTSACEEQCTYDPYEPDRTVCEIVDSTCYPGDPTAETCNGIDDDCDGATDDGVLLNYYTDGDGDGYGAGAPVAQGCAPPAGLVTNNTDCNDGNSAVYPGAIKLCGTGACRNQVQACVNGVEQTCTPKPPSTEACDGGDNDCNGVKDDVTPKTCGIGACFRSYSACMEACHYDPDEPDRTTCEIVDDPSACVPGNPVAEICNNGIDEDCNGIADDGPPSAYVDFYLDADGDGYGSAWQIVRACTRPQGYVLDKRDCDDTRAEIRPGATEVCDGFDNDCDRAYDEQDVCRVGNVCQ